MTVINTNSAALRAQNASRTASMSMSQAMERLSSGKRINSAKDDAAGLAVATRMTSDIRGLTVAIRNANDGISLAQTAESAMGDTTNILQRMRELGVQSANGTISDSDRSNLQIEVAQLKDQIGNIADRTAFNNISIVNGGTAERHHRHHRRRQLHAADRRQGERDGHFSVDLAEDDRSRRRPCRAGIPATTAAVTTAQATYNATPNPRNLTALNTAKAAAAAAPSSIDEIDLSTAANSTAALAVVDTRAQPGDRRPRQPGCGAEPPRRDGRQPDLDLDQPDRRAQPHRGRRLLGRDDRARQVADPQPGRDGDARPGQPELSRAS